MLGTGNDRSLLHSVNEDQLTDFPSLESIRERRNSTSSIPGRLDLASTAIESGYEQDTDQTTIIIRGLPKDISEREFSNVFTFAVGFEAAILKRDEYCDSDRVEMSKNGSNNFISVGLPNIWTISSNSTLTTTPVTATPPSSPSHTTGDHRIIGLARFTSCQYAIDARDWLNERIKSLDNGQTGLNVQVAKHNIWTTNDLMMLFDDHPAPANAYHHQQPSYPLPYPNSHTLGMAAASRRHSIVMHPPYSYPYPGIHQQQPSPHYSAYINRYQQLQMIYNQPPVNSQSVLTSRPPSVTPRATPLPISANENPPCNTLYVGNLPPMATEDELRRLFSPSPGFKRLSFRHKPNGPMCFVEFEDIAHATAAMEALYGTMLSCSSKGGIRLSYSKNPLGVRSNQLAPRTVAPFVFTPTAINPPPPFL